MFSLEHKKNGFTLIEVLVALSMFAIAGIGIIFAINRTYLFINKTRYQITAINLAREGVEMMYNLRDSNWRRYSGIKDDYWLKYDGSNDMNVGLYKINEVKGVNGHTGDTYITLSRLNLGTNDLENCYSDDGFKDCGLQDATRVIFTGSYYYLSGDNLESGKIVTGNVSDLFNDVKYYRVVRIYWIQNKLEGSSGKSTDPKELRFCVKVFYNNSSRNEMELCSIMTNFDK